ncbi:hypothetical protein DAI22_06g233500 [Oryza sativa Japonica Group]|jgi:hypothetical protein|nr:hypothetical protein DAI22_06g233500 [Oryza sativa Japonica Group]
MRAVAWMLIHGRSSVMGAGNRRLVLSDVASVPWHELLSVMNGYFGLSVSILQSSLLTLA